ncbi:EF-hand domain-containing protein [Kitasatospora sp. NPDC056651]|uniref:EF-hand domain-containing protein n=1 Tax=Kitasatospora sp. NPDC056651 TaxID=3345892 RepID=UPI0036B0C111
MTAVGAYQQRVLELFDTIDADLDGAITWDDFQRVIDRQLGAGPQRRLVEEEFDGLWAALRDAGLDHGGRVFRGELLADADRRAAGSTPDPAPEHVTRFACAAYCLMDTGRDGRVGKAQFRQYLKARSITDPAAVEEFDRLDRSGAGFLTRDDLRAAGRRFFADPNPGVPRKWLTALFFA